ncbi:MAG: hypothetical protein HY756_00370 [Nitrospirae bacterium]|nr:hypothetical protein [Nitrospirota bacterium]
MDKTKRIVIDTNLLIRYLVNDDTRKAQRVETLLSKAGRGEEFLFHKLSFRDVGLGLSLPEAGGYRNNASKSLGVIILMP